ncbi:MAG: aspartate aminotransferase [Rhodospirillaceae bacterium]|nr:aspartate aminotransferase [Rhodospirillaceae bacterium]|tara:strand:- start:2200 stop:3363 length:1164 start_codon:yes stop_codon:yes gene_type:complete
MQINKLYTKIGTETAFDILAKAEKLKSQGKDVINLGIGQPDFSSPVHVVEAAIKALKDGHHGYTPANGILELREAVAKNIYNFRSVNVNPDNILIMPGAKPIMYFAIIIFGEPGFEIMYPNPGFPIYESAINLTGAKPVPIELKEDNSFSFKAESVLEKITAKTRLIILNSPANPTGGITNANELDILVKGLEKFPNVTILSDEIYSRIIYDDIQFNSLLKYEQLRDRLIILDGWSKTYAMTGWRLGWSLWPKKLIEIATRLAINTYSCVNAPTQFAGIAALNGPQDNFDFMLNEFNKRRNVIHEQLNSINNFSCIKPKGAFYAFANIKKTGLTSNQVQDLILNEANVATVAGTSFGELGEGFIRFSYAASLDNINKAMERISTIFN